MLDLILHPSFILYILLICHCITVKYGIGENLKILCCVYHITEQIIY